MTKLLTFLAVCLFAVASHAQVIITSISRNYGAPGDPTPIFINGSGFYPGQLVVLYNGVRDWTAMATSPTVIQSTVPATATSGRISVSVNGSVPAYSELFVVGPKPYVKRFSPVAGGHDTLVTLEGAYFEGAAVRFGSRLAREVNAQFNLITCKPPLGVTNGAISVTTAYGTFTTSSNFFAPPVITGFEPKEGRAGTNVLIMGTNFLGATDFFFAGTNGEISSVFTVLSNRAARLTVPPGAISGSLRVQTPGGTFITNLVFKVQPVISGFSPLSGPPGTSVTVQGANFIGTSKTNVYFNGTPATLVGKAEFDRVTVLVPATATTGPIRVETSDGTNTSAGVFYLPPTITSFTPNHGPAGTTVVITGANLTNASAVTFNGSPASFFPPTNNSTLLVSVPAAFSSGPISVTTPGGTATSATAFYGAPFINAVIPPSGLPGTLVTIQGQNLLDASAVLFNGISVSPGQPTSNNAITAVVPAGAQTGPLVVITPGGAYTNTQPFVLDYRSDLQVNLNAPAESVVTSNLTYFLQVRNFGPHPATNVWVTNNLSSLVRFTEFLQNGPSWHTNTPHEVVLYIPTMSVGASTNLMFESLAAAPGTATARSSVVSAYVDPDLNNSQHETTTIIYPLPVLSVSRPAAKLVKVSWHVMLTNYTLQAAAPVPMGAEVWTNYTTEPLISGDEKSVTEPATTPGKVYRLKR